MLIFIFDSTLSLDFYRIQGETFRVDHSLRESKRYYAGWQNSGLANRLESGDLPVMKVSGWAWKGVELAGEAFYGSKHSFVFYNRRIFLCNPFVSLNLAWAI